MTPLDSLLPLAADGTVLRRLAPGDVQRFHAYRSDAGLARYQGWSPMTLPQAQAFIDEMAGVATLRTGEWIQLAIAEPGTDRLIGDLGLFLDADGAAAELGFTLCREAQGRGHATRAVRAATGLVHAACAARTVRGVTDARNRASMRVLERAAFSRSHTQDAVFKGEACTEVVYVHHRADR